MTSEKRQAALKTAIGAVVLAIVFIAVVGTVMRKGQESKDFVVRTEICASVCVRREAEFHSVYEQSLGFGASASEWRCGCTDGHVQVIP